MQMDMGLHFRFYLYITLFCKKGTVRSDPASTLG
jgi:hypothetical protein